MVWKPYFDVVIGQIIVVISFQGVNRLVVNGECYNLNYSLGCLPYFI